MRSVAKGIVGSVVVVSVSAKDDRAIFHMGQQTEAGLQHLFFTEIKGTKNHAVMSHPKFNELLGQIDGRITKVKDGTAGFSNNMTTDLEVQFFLNTKREKDVQTWSIDVNKMKPSSEQEFPMLDKSGKKIAKLDDEGNVVKEEGETVYEQDKRNIPAGALKGLEKTFKKVEFVDMSNIPSLKATKGILSMFAKMNTIPDFGKHLAEMKGLQIPSNLRWDIFGVKKASELAQKILIKHATSEEYDKLSDVADVFEIIKKAKEKGQELRGNLPDKLDYETLFTDIVKALGEFPETKKKFDKSKYSVKSVRIVNWLRMNIAVKGFYEYDTKKAADGVTDEPTKDVQGLPLDKLWQNYESAVATIMDADGLDLEVDGDSIPAHDIKFPDSRVGEHFAKMVKVLGVPGCVADILNVGAHIWKIPGKPKPYEIFAELEAFYDDAAKVLNDKSLPVDSLATFLDKADIPDRIILDLEYDDMGVLLIASSLYFLRDLLHSDSRVPADKKEQFLKSTHSLEVVLQFPTDQPIYKVATKKKKEDPRSFHEFMKTVKESTDGKDKFPQFVILDDKRSLNFEKVTSQQGVTTFGWDWEKMKDFPYTAPPPSKGSTPTGSTPTGSTDSTPTGSTDSTATVSVSPAGAGSATTESETNWVYVGGGIAMGCLLVLCVGLIVALMRKQKNNVDGYSSVDESDESQDEEEAPGSAKNENEENE